MTKTELKVAAELVSRYLANYGVPKNEFVACITPVTGGRIHKLWRRLAKAVEKDGVPIPPRRK